MRSFTLACLFLTLAAPAVAQDRYGPQSAVRAAPISYAPVALLRWAGKVEPAAPQAAIEDPMRPLSDGVLRRASVYGAAPSNLERVPESRPAPPVAVASAAPAAAENAPWRRLTGASPAPRPTTAPAAMEEAAPQSLPATPVVASPSPAVSAPRPAAAASGEQARYYSLHREYGETPDAIPAPVKNQVFLAGGPLTSGVGDADDAIDTESTGRTAALNKARLAADWGSSTAK